VAAALASAVALGALSASAKAETKTFIVASAPDAYGVDQCLATGDHCGVYAADAYCETKSFTKARSYRRVEPGDVTASVALANPPGPQDSLVAIECTR
jgi:hypothetical protein